MLPSCMHAKLSVVFKIEIMHPAYYLHITGTCVLTHTVLHIHILCLHTCRYTQSRHMHSLVPSLPDNKDRVGCGRGYHMHSMIVVILPRSTTHTLLTPSPYPSPSLFLSLSFSLSLLPQGLVYCIWSCSVLEKMRRAPKTITLASIGLSPYENRFVRSLVDACAFQIYSHWVKRGEEQNRAALFENVPKKYSPLSSSSINVKLHNNSEISRLPITEQQSGIALVFSWCVARLFISSSLPSVFVRYFCAVYCVC